MPSDPPRTPEGLLIAGHESPKRSSPKIITSLPTPAHSVSGSMSLSAADVLVMSDEMTSKRKREIDDQGDRESKKVHVEDARLTIEDLHLDVGEKYLLLCKTGKIPSPWTVATID